MSKKKQWVLPKKIAGVKVPRKARKGRFAELLASPAGQKLIAEAIIAGGVAIAGKLAAQSPKARKAVRAAKDKAESVVSQGVENLDKGPAWTALPKSD
jgi:hypothetical protein